MKRLLTLLIAVAATLAATAKLSAPDFAYPATVSANALADLEKATRDHDAHQALNALIRYTVATNLIDTDSLQHDIRMAEDVAASFADSPLSGIFRALLGDMYLGMYRAKAYVYDQRQLPLTPLPEDLTEWSGDQFKDKIAQLAGQSTDPAAAGRLATLPIGDYADIITADKLTATYYPTLLDFAYQNAATLYTATGRAAKSDELYRQALANSPAGTAQHTLWLYRTLDSQTTDTEETDDGDDTRFDNTLKAVEENMDNPYGGLLLIALGERVNTSLTDRKSLAYLKASETYLQKNPGTEFKNDILNTANAILQPALDMTAPRMCAPGSPMKLKIHGKNATDIDIKIYYYGEKAPASAPTASTLAQFLKTCRLTATKSIHTGKTTPCANDTTVEITLDKPGHYYLIPSIPGTPTVSNQRPAATWCVPVFPVSIGNGNDGEIIVTAPATGTPVAGAAVALSTTDRRTPRTIQCGTTDQEGKVRYAATAERAASYYPEITWQGNGYKFDNVSVRAGKNDEQTDTAYSATVLTDLGIYHPGDKARALAIVSAHHGSGDMEYRHTAAGMKVTFLLKNANYETVAQADTVTDGFGRATATLDIPADGLTGGFRVVLTRATDPTYLGTATIMVSDYRMPEFEVTLNEPECDTPAQGTVTISGAATSYSGMPVARATVTLTLTETSWWGVKYRNGNARPTYAAESVTDSDGKFSITVPDSVITNRKQLYRATTDAVAPDGSAASASTVFSLRRQYHITVDIPGENIDGEKPFTPVIEARNAAREEADIAMTWQLMKDGEAILSGKADSTPIDLSGVTPGRYTLEVTAEDPGIADPETCAITIYNRASGIVPDNDALFIPTATYTITGERRTINAEYATADDSYVYYYLTSGDKTVESGMLRTTAGYHTMKITPGATDRKMTLLLVTIKNFTAHTGRIDIATDETEGLTITGETFRDRLTPGATETWKFKITRADGQPAQAALALDMYNKALDALCAHTFAVTFPGRANATNLRASWPRNYNGSYSIRGTLTTATGVQLRAPEFNLYGYSLSPMVLSRYASTSVNLKIRGVGSVSADMAAPMALADTAEESAEAGAATENESAETPDTGTPDYRDPETAGGIWAPTLTTDAEGDITYTYTVPNANTTWKLRAAAWTHTLEAGNLIREFIANKPVMVQPNLPRYMRGGDSCTVQATVMNNTDSTQTVTTTIGTFDPMTGAGLTTETHTLTLGPRESTTLGIDIKAEPDRTAIGYRVRSAAGTFADGEQAVIRILTDQTALTEATPFYLNPGDTTFRTKLPGEKDARLSLTFYENPAWTIVTALPGLRDQDNDYANSAAAAIFSACVARGITDSNPAIAGALKAWRDTPADSALVSMLEKNEDLKQATLNSTPWVQAAQSQDERMANLLLTLDDKANDEAIAKGIRALRKLHNDDGGWSWGPWSEESSVWVTANVLDMLGQLRISGWLPTDPELQTMTGKALAYYDNNVKDTDITYATVRPRFDQPVSANGQKVIKATIAEIRANWKKYADPAKKAMAAQALYLNGHEDTARELLASLSQFGVYTKDQGLRFPNVSDLYEYGLILGAYGLIAPGSKETDGLRQQLIVRKEATDWGTSVVTTEVVKAILTSGSDWTTAATAATVTAGDTEVRPTGAAETATGWIRADLTPYAGQQLIVETTGTGPAYGAVYAQYERKTSDIKAVSITDLDIEKQLFVRRGEKWEQAGELKTGDRVKVQLTIHCKRDMQYVSITDDRPAAFEPVEQTPGWMWSEGVGFYRENRDTRTNLHVVYMRPGTYLLTYEMNVNLAGDFTSGVATIQSQYAPSLTAHSGGGAIRVR